MMDPGLAAIDRWIDADPGIRCVVYSGGGKWWPAECTHDGPQQIELGLEISLSDLAKWCEARMRGAVLFISRKEALARLKKPEDSRLRNYEIEERLAVRCEAFDPTKDPASDHVVVTDWCPFDGRFCALSRYVPFPHPPMNGEDPSEVKNTAVTWRSWEPSMTKALRP